MLPHNNQSNSVSWGKNCHYVTIGECKKFSEFSNCNKSVYIFLLVVICCSSWKKDFNSERFKRQLTFTWFLHTECKYQSLTATFVWIWALKALHLWDFEKDKSGEIVEIERATWRQELKLLLKNGLWKREKSLSVFSSKGIFANQDLDDVAIQAEV